jgi:microcystin-dependent protein
MAQPYVGEIRMFAGNFAPAGWMFCEGQLLPISENETLFQLIGTTYGGDGEATFGLPDLRGRINMHQGNTFVLAEQAGVEEVTLTQQQIPVHSHGFVCSANPGDVNQPQDRVLATSAATKIFREANANQPFANQIVLPAGGSQPHTNFQPYLCIDFIISLFGIFPSPT